VDPKFTKSNTDKLLANRPAPYTESPLPMRPKLFVDMEEPMLT
jgi:hypothetical protein